MAEMLYAFLIGDYRRAAEVHFEAGYVPPHKSLDSFTQACRSVGAPILGRPVIYSERLLGDSEKDTKVDNGIARVTRKLCDEV